jgi:integral membrane protein (TIGR00529 family)
MELLKIIIIFIFIIGLLSWKKPLPIVMAAAAVLLAILFRIPILDFLRQYALAVFNFSLLELLLTLFFIMVLEHIMSKNGYMQNMLSAMDNLFHSKKVDIAVLPMLIGFLPSAGGALFSAPLVVKAAEDTSLTPESITFINSYYRHIMEIFFPTYPAILLAAQLSGQPFSRLIIYLFPFAIVTFGLGLWHLRGIPKQQKPAKENTEPTGKLILTLIKTLWPFLLLIGLILLTPLPVYIICGITLITLLIVIKQPLKTLPAVIWGGTKLRLLITVITVMAFKDLLIFSGAVDILATAFTQVQFPPYLIFALLMVFISAMTGMTVASVGIGLPIALAAMPEAGLPFVILLSISAYIGCQITPMHLCITIVSESLGANIQKVLLKSLPAYGILFILAIIVYNILR